MSKTRIEPVRLPDGKLITPIPPCGGSWETTADGAIKPRDPATARAAGLDWAPAAPAAPAPAVSAPAPAAATK